MAIKYSNIAAAITGNARDRKTLRGMTHRGVEHVTGPIVVPRALINNVAAGTACYVALCPLKLNARLTSVTAGLTVATAAGDTGSFNLQIWEYRDDYGESDPTVLSNSAVAATTTAAFQVNFSLANAGGLSDTALSPNLLSPWSSGRTIYQECSLAPVGVTWTAGTQLNAGEEAMIPPGTADGLKWVPTANFLNMKKRAEFVMLGISKLTGAAINDKGAGPGLIIHLSYVEMTEPGMPRLDQVGL